MIPGQSLNLTCSSGGATSVYWYRHNGVNAQRSNVTSSTCSDVSVTSIVENRQCSSQLNIIVGAIDNGATYGCAAVFPATGDVIAADPEIHLTVFCKHLSKTFVSGAILSFILHCGKSYT